MNVDHNKGELPATAQEMKKAVEDGTLSKEAMTRIHQQALMAWAVIIIRGLRGSPESPSSIMLHAQGVRLYVRSIFKKKVAAMATGVQEKVYDLVLLNVPHYNFNPASGIEVVPDGFGEEWPPKDRMAADAKLDADSRRLIQVASPVDVKNITSVPSKKGRVRR